MICFVAIPTGRSSGTPAHVSKVVSRSPWLPFTSGKNRPVLIEPPPRTSQNEGQVFPSVLVAVFKAGAPHHDAVVQKRAVAFPQVVHLFHHVSKLLDIECCDRGHFLDLLRLVVVVSLGMVLVIESEFRIRHTVRGRSNIGADAGRVGLERQHVEVTHHLHVLAAFITLWNLDLDGRRVGFVTAAGADARLLQSGLFLDAVQWQQSVVPPSEHCPGIRPVFAGRSGDKVRRRSRAPSRTKSNMFRSNLLISCRCPPTALFLFVEQSI